MGEAPLAGVDLIRVDDVGVLFLNLPEVPIEANAHRADGVAFLHLHVQDQLTAFSKASPPAHIGGDP